MQVMKAFDPRRIAFRNFKQDWNPVCYFHKNHTLVFVTFVTVETV